MAVAACPHCGHESEADVCPLCGTEMPAAAAAAPDEAPTGAARGAPERTDRVAWEDPGVGFPRDAWTTWRDSLFEPASFFGRLDHGGPLSRPVFYLLLVTVAGAFCHLLWQAFLYVPLTGEAAFGGDLYVIQFFTTPFFVLAGLAVETLLLHLFVLMLAPDHRGMGSTARVICYAAGPAVLLAVPFVGGLAGWVWSLVLQVVGIREAHRTTTGRAVVVALAPVIVGLAAGLLLALLVALSVGRGELATWPGSLPLPFR